MKKFLLGLTLISAFAVAGGCSKNESERTEDKDKDATDWEVVVYGPKGDTAAYIISDKDPIPFGGTERTVIDVKDKRTGQKVKFTTGTTVVAKEIPAVK